MSYVVGVVSDTHGHLDDWVIPFFEKKKVSVIVHAGDVVSADVLVKLERVAPVTAVRGNMDGAAVGPLSAVVECDGVCFFVLHNIDQLDLDPVAAGFAGVISGHTHVPQITWKRGVLFFNPGSVSCPRHGNGASVGLIRIGASRLEPEIVFEP